MKSGSGNPYNLSNYEVQMKSFPYPKYVHDFFIERNLAPNYFLLLCFWYSVGSICKAIVQEKESRMKETMKMMGLPNWVLWASWFTKCFLFLLISALIITVFFKAPLGDCKGCSKRSILPESDWSLFVIFLLSYIFSIITFAFLIASLCSKCKSFLSSTYDTS